MTALIIDGKINPEFVGRDIDRYYVCNGLVKKRESESNGVTHGTIVTQVVSQYGCFDEIYAIEILNDDEKGNVHDLIAALMWCKNKKIGFKSGIFHPICAFYESLAWRMLLG